MNRDNDLLREMLFKFEAQEDWIILMPMTPGMGEEERRQAGHIDLLCDAGLVAPVNEGTYRLTNDGHDYLEAIRDEGVWSKVKETVKATGGNATLEIVKQIAIGYLKKKISDHTGIEL